MYIARVPERLNIPIPSYKRTATSTQEDDWDDTDPELLNRDLTSYSSSTNIPRPPEAVSATNSNRHLARNSESNERSRLDTGRDFSSTDGENQPSRPLSSRELREREKRTEREESRSESTQNIRSQVSTTTLDDETNRECHKMMAGRGAALRSLGLIIFRIFVSIFSINKILFFFFKVSKKRRTYPEDE